MRPTQSLFKIMRKLLYCFLILFVSYGYSQQNGGEVIYSISQNTAFAKNLQKEKRSSTKSLIAGLNENLKEIKLSLVFGADNSAFYTLKSAPMASSRYQGTMQDFAKNIAHSGDYYRSANNGGVFYRPNSFSDVDLIVHYQDLEWELVYEQKKIGKYNCYKAKAEMVLENNKGPFIRNVIAWYCPDIPVSYGPSRFGGLPGLILELDEGEFHYKAINVLLKDKVKIPNVPLEKSKVVSDEEYRQLILEKIGETRELFSN